MYVRSHGIVKHFASLGFNGYLSHSSYDLNSHMTVCITCTYMYMLAETYMYEYMYFNRIKVVF